MFPPLRLGKEFSCETVTNILLCKESSLHTLVVAISGKPQASFEVFKNKLCERAKVRINLNSLVNWSIVLEVAFHLEVFCCPCFV